MIMKRLVTLCLTFIMLMSLFACDKIDIKFGHDTEDTPAEEDNNDEQQPQVTTYIYSVLSKSIHLPDCYHINEIKEEYKKELSGDPTSLLENGYTLCKDCFPPEDEPEPDKPEEPQIPKDQATFLINVSSKKIHKLDCYHIGEMSEKNIKYTDLTLEELLEDEHIPCATCLPEQWEQYKKDHPEDFPEDK